MTIYHCAVIEKTEDAHVVLGLDGIDMENVDYKRQPDAESVLQCITKHGGMLCGILRGGMFGFATNQIWVFSAWENTDAIQKYTPTIEGFDNYCTSAQEQLIATVRPAQAVFIDRPGIYVVRWIRMQSSDIDEYTQLCLETWPRFEENSQARCYGVFRPFEKQEGVEKILMLTWYATLNDWEQSRQFDPVDKAKWARRSEIEQSHWAEVGRLA
jgi:hypothetical protein